MKKEYLYKKQLNGRGRFGGVELEFTSGTKISKVIDKCVWKDWTSHNSNFEETTYMKSIKSYIMDAIDHILKTINTTDQCFEISLIDIKIFPVDTVPSHILASAIIGTFELLGQSLNAEKMIKIDQFIIQNENIEFPEYDKFITKLLTTN
ncbi:hypothetical protein [Tenacibaculum sp. 190524A05c]|uniref:hypothetical protein n=1 Tax=Tenacibaculum platacis TaxID=3137852 RepID=UPI0032B2B5E4